MIAEDIKIRKAVTVVLIRTCVDFTRLKVHVIRGNVQLGGFFTTMRRQRTLIHDRSNYIEQTKKLLSVIHREVRRIRGVGHLRMKFQNWEKVPGSGWIEQRVK